MLCKRRTPLRPEVRASHRASGEFPKGLMSPSPVMTTRRGLERGVCMRGAVTIRWSGVGDLVRLACEFHLEPIPKPPSRRDHPVRWRSWDKLLVHYTHTGLLGTSEAR